MTRTWTSTRLRWAVPAAAAGAVALASALPALAGSSGTPSLAAVTAQQLLTEVQQPTTDTFSGTLTETADLGLPQLPGTAGGTSANTLSLLAGGHTLRVWSDGAERERVSLLGQTSEQDVVRNARDLYVHASDGDTVTHYALPAGDERGDAVAPAADLTPSALAARWLADADPSTAVSVGAPVTVAGRAAYTLLATPRTAGTLVGSVRFAVDAATHLPLRVQVFARGASSPALQVGYTSFSTARPDASVFAAPQGTTVKQGELPHPDTHGRADATAPSTLGDGWAGVLVVPADSTGSVAGGAGKAGHLRNRQVDAVTSVVPGGRGVQTALFSVLLADDGRVLVGAVPLSTLSADAA